MKYLAYVIGIFTLTFGAVVIYYGSARKTYRKRYGK